LFTRGCNLFRICVKLRVCITIFSFPFVRSCLFFPPFFSPIERPRRAVVLSIGPSLSPPPPSFCLFLLFFFSLHLFFRFRFLSSSFLPPWGSKFTAQNDALFPILPLSALLTSPFLIPTSTARTGKGPVSSSNPVPFLSRLTGAPLLSSYWRQLRFGLSRSPFVHCCFEHI